MTRCVEFYEKCQREGLDWCKKAPGTVSQIQSYLELINEMGDYAKEFGVEKSVLYKRFPEGTMRSIWGIKDKEVRKATLIVMLGNAYSPDHKVPDDVVEKLGVELGKSRQHQQAERAANICKVEEAARLAREEEEARWQPGHPEVVERYKTDSRKDAATKELYHMLNDACVQRDEAYLDIAMLEFQLATSDVEVERFLSKSDNMWILFEQNQQTSLQEFINENFGWSKYTTENGGIEKFAKAKSEPQPETAPQPEPEPPTKKKTRTRKEKSPEPESGELKILSPPMEMRAAEKAAKKETVAFRFKEGLFEACAWGQLNEEWIGICNANGDQKFIRKENILKGNHWNTLKKLQKYTPSQMAFDLAQMNKIKAAEP